MKEAEVTTIYDKGWNTKGPYLTRVELERWRIHVFHRGDADPDMHDHPSDFWTFPLVSYVEEVPHAWSKGHTTWRVVKAFRPHFRKAEHTHRLLGAWTGERMSDGTPKYDPRKPVVTIVRKGRNRRDWGFHTPDGWVHWEAYVG